MIFRLPPHDLPPPLGDFGELLGLAPAAGPGDMGLAGLNCRSSMNDLPTAVMPGDEARHRTDLTITSVSGGSGDLSRLPPSRRRRPGRR